MYVSQITQPSTDFTTPLGPVPAIQVSIARLHTLHYQIPFSPKPPVEIQNTLRHSLHRIALIRTHSLPINKLDVRIRRINNICAIRDRERREPIPGPELAAPAAADGKDATADAAVTGVLGDCSIGSIDAVVTGGYGRDVRVDEEVVVTEGVVGAGTGEGFEGPFGGVGYGHGLGGCDGG